MNKTIIHSNATNLAITQFFAPSMNSNPLHILYLHYLPTLAKVSPSINCTPARSHPPSSPHPGYDFTPHQCTPALSHPPLSVHPSIFQPSINSTPCTLSDGPSTYPCTFSPS